MVSAFYSPLLQSTPIAQGRSFQTFPELERRCVSPVTVSKSFYNTGHGSSFPKMSRDNRRLHINRLFSDINDKCDIFDKQVNLRKRLYTGELRTDLPVHCPGPIDCSGDGGVWGGKDWHVHYCAKESSLDHDLVPASMATNPYLRLS